MAHCHTIGGTRLCTPQGHLSKCPSPQIWLDPGRHALIMCLMCMETTYQWNMPCPVLGEDFPQSEIRDLTATLTEVCNNVCTEPELQPVSQEALRAGRLSQTSGQSTVRYSSQQLLGRD